MTKYPFMNYVNEFMKRMNGVYALTTWKTAMRRYDRINSDVMILYREGKISSTSPKSMTIDDVREYLTYRRSFDYSGKEYSHDESALKKLFKFAKNDAVEDCLTNYPMLKARKKQSRLPPMDDGTYQKILRNASNINQKDHKRVRAYALVLLATRAGTRTKEIRLASIDDLDTKQWMFDVVHVKGEKTYGEPRTVPVHPEIRSILTSYLQLREKYVIMNNVNSKALFPSPTSKDGYMSENSLRRIKQIVEADIGETFDFRMLRRTFGQQLVDAGVDIESVSVAMGHACTVTTERSYARKRSETANAKIMGSW
jgi:site-specific recombinase XerD